MEKIPTVFVRDDNDRSKVIVGKVTPGCEWVYAPGTYATRKFDGTCVRVVDGKGWARREVKPGKEAPENFVAISTDEVTGKTVGWEPIEQSGFAKFFVEATDGVDLDALSGTFELCGPRINGNPEHLSRHALIPHGAYMIPGVMMSEADILGVMEFCRGQGWEGIVLYGANGERAKLKVKDVPDSLMLAG